MKIKRKQKTKIIHLFTLYYYDNFFLKILTEPLASKLRLN